MTKTPRTAAVVGCALLAAAAWSAYRARWSTSEILVATGITLILIGLTIPAWARAFDKGWMKIASGLAYFNTRVLLSMVYVAILAPYGFVIRLSGRDSLQRRGPAKPSDWRLRPTTRQTKDQFERLF